MLVENGKQAQLVMSAVGLGKGAVAGHQATLQYSL